jgi:hypothetical protein
MTTGLVIRARPEASTIEWLRSLVQLQLRTSTEIFSSCVASTGCVYNPKGILGKHGLNVWR